VVQRFYKFIVVFFLLPGVPGVRAQQWQEKQLPHFPFQVPWAATKQFNRISVSLLHDIPKDLFDHSIGITHAYFINVNTCWGPDLEPRISLLHKTIPVSQDFYYCNLGVFCKGEVIIEKAMGIPLRLRVGSLEYVNKLEGK